MGSETVKVESLEALDCLVATQVMGWTVDGDCFPFRPTAYIVDAWEVVERMRQQGFDGLVAWVASETRWTAMFEPNAGKDADAAPSAALAISIAALRAKGVEVELAAPEAGDTETEEP